MVYDAGLMKDITGKTAVPPAHSSFAIKCENPADVDTAVAAIQKASFGVIKDPWDAFWGQRYAIVMHPDFYTGDVFAPLIKA